MKFKKLPALVKQSINLFIFQTFVLNDDKKF